MINWTKTNAAGYTDSKDGRFTIKKNFGCVDYELRVDGKKVLEKNRMLKTFIRFKDAKEFAEKINNGEVKVEKLTLPVYKRMGTEVIGTREYLVMA